MIDAALYGFLPENDSDTNARALQEAVSQRGTIRIDRPGIYDISETILLDDDTTVIFGAGVYLRRAKSADGTQHASYVFINRGAYTRTYNQNIQILGLHLICNGMEASTGPRIPGLRGHLSFFYAKNITVRDFECLDLLAGCFCIHVCTFENLIVENVHIEGRKDAVHLGRGSKFVIRHGIFRTFDAPIALNAHDYASSNPQMGWIENGLIEDCYDLDQPDTVGFFCRILAGSWCDWTPGMQVQNSDSVIHNGRLYRVLMAPDGKVYTSHTPPTHTEGAMDLDGIHWVMVQDDHPIYNCGCRNIHFKHNFLEKQRPIAISIHFDHDNWSRSVYPNSPAPVQEDLIFENIYFLNDIPRLIWSITPVNSIKLINSVLKNSAVELEGLDIPGLEYGKTHILLSGTTFKGEGEQPVAICQDRRSATLKIVGSIQEKDSFVGTTQGDVKVLASDIPLKG